MYLTIYSDFLLCICFTHDCNAHGTCTAIRQEISNVVGLPYFQSGSSIVSRQFSSAANPTVSSDDGLSDGSHY